MPATAPEFTRRTLLFAALATCLRADSADDVWDVMSTAASDLSDGHIDDFLQTFDRAMPGFDTLRNSVTTLLSQADVQSSIELVSNEGNDQKRKLEVDWLMRITGHANVSGSVSRQEPVKFSFEKQGKRWRIVSLEPLSFFTPPPAN